MRIFRSQVAGLAQEIVAALLQDGDIETDAPREVQQDVASVLEQYIRDEQDLTERAREVLDRTGMAPREFARVKQRLADERKLKLGDDAVDYLLDQLLEILMHSHNVEEIYAEDVDMRRKMRRPLRRARSAEADMDAEVRGRLKHVQEGTSMWEVEYKRMMDDIRRRKGV